MTTDYILREATPDDAEALIAFMQAVSGEPNNFITRSSAAEFTYTVEEEREILRRHRDAENCLWIVAVTPEDEVIGTANATGGRNAAARTTSIGISLAPAWRDRGIGTAMMRLIIGWAQATPAVHRLELEVFAHNARAIHIYEKLGFRYEGTRKEAFFKDGRYIDAHVMAILFHRRANDEN